MELLKNIDTQESVERFRKAITNSPMRMVLVEPGDESKSEDLPQSEKIALTYRFLNPSKNE